MLAITAVGCGDDDGGGPAPALRITGTVIAPGQPNSSAAAHDNLTAYVGTQSAVLVLDLSTQRFERLLPSAMNQSIVDAVDDTDTHLAVRDPAAGLLALADGSFMPLIGGGFFRRTSLANGFLYAPDFNGRVLWVAPVDGGSQFSINPYEGTTRIAGPTNSARSPSGRTVIFGDEFSGSIHVVDTETNTLRGSFIAGGSPRDVFALTDDLAIAIFDGTIAYVPLEDPNRVPELFRIGLLSNAGAWAVDHENQRLYVVRYDGGPYTDDPITAEAGVLDLTTREEIGARLPIDFMVNPRFGSVPFFSIAVTEDGRTVILTVSDSTVYLLTPTGGPR
jgi:DNA-binding beta-propeller fold protein YncE